MTEQPAGAVGQSGTAARVAGAFLWRVGPFAGLAVLAVAVPAAVLVPAGLWRPSVAIPVVLVGLAAAWRLSRAAAIAAGASGAVDATTVRAAAWTAAIAAGTGVWAGLTHAENMILRRDPGSYALFAQWIGSRHELPVASHLDAFGGTAALAVPGFTLGSPAYYQVVHGGAVDVVPQFLLGGPATFSLGWWAGGWTGMFLVPPLLGMLAVAGFAGLVARLAGPRWAPVGAGLLALTFPVLHAARSTYSEAPALVIMLGAAALALDAATVGGREARRLGLTAGLMLGLSGLVRVDSLTEVALVVPVCAVLAARAVRAGSSGEAGSAHAVALALGALGGVALAAIPAVWLSRPYLDTIRGSLLPLVAGTAVLTLLSVAFVLLARLRARRDGRAVTPRPSQGRAWPRAAAAGVLLLGAALVSRPLWTVSRQDPNDPGALYVAALQRSQHLAVDGGRTYAEHSLAWVSWWIGPVAIAAAWICFAVLAHRAVGWWRAGSARAPAWLIPATVGFGSSVLTLARPGITPDHPWADRRLVVVLLPTLLLAAVVAAARCRAWTARTLPGRQAVWVTGTAMSALFVPVLAGSAPFAIQRTEAGEPATVARVCAALHPGDVVLAVDPRAANEWPQVIRGVCDHPAAAITLETAQRATSVAQLGRMVQARGGHLVLLASSGGDDAQQVLRDLGTDPQLAAMLRSVEDQRTLARAPWRNSRLVTDVWLADWTG